MHIGNFRTALYSYMWAKKNAGEFILRVEDTDRKRYVKGSVEGYMELFNAFDLHIDKFPSEDQIKKLDEVDYPSIDWFLDENTYSNINDEDFEGIYIQTQRLPLYLKYAQKLVNDGHAYLCFLSEEELKNLKESMPTYQPFRSPDRFLSSEERMQKIKEGKPYVVRLNVENFIKQKGDILEYEDLVLGKMKFDLNTVDDQVLIKSNGIPTYHLAVVVDDQNMDITHPIRGYGWLPSTPKQILIYNILGWEMKPFAHVTDILDPAGGKLSKRKGAVFTTEFIKEGYLTDAIINFITLVGWTPKIERKFGEREREIFSLDELINLFSIEGISKTNPIFDREKLLWFNKEYIKNYDNSKLNEKFKKWLEKYSEDELKNTFFSDENLEAKVALVKDRARTLKEILESIKFFYVAPENIDWNIKQLSAVSGQLSAIKSEILEVIQKLEENSLSWTHEEWENGMRAIGDKFEIKHGDVFMVLRMAVVGAPFSPPLFECLQILGKEEVLKRLGNA